MHVNGYSDRNMFITNNPVPFPPRWDVTVELFHKTTSEIVGTVTIHTDGTMSVHIKDQYNAGSGNNIYPILDEVRDFRAFYTTNYETPHG